MLFRWIALLSVIAVVGRLTYRRFRTAVPIAGRFGAARIGDYFSWLIERAGRLAGPVGRERLRSFLLARIFIYPETSARWAFVGLVTSFAYLAASGFLFAVFSRRGLYGIPLLLHVIGGGIFAVSLAVFLFFQARHHERIFDSLGGKNIRSWDSILFWVFILAGLTLTATALGSMLPYFSFETQVKLIETHRYSALVSLLTAIAFLDLEIPSAPP